MKKEELKYKSFIIEKDFRFIDNEGFVMRFEKKDNIKLSEDIMKGFFVIRDKNFRYVGVVSLSDLIKGIENTKFAKEVIKFNEELYGK